MPLKILVTGATGQIDRCVVETLKEDYSLDVTASVPSLTKERVFRCRWFNTTSIHPCHA
jgi:dihydrodipicolinate reductase